MMYGMMYLIIFGVRAVASASHWTYHDYGSLKWDKDFQTCKGERQSPININYMTLENFIFDVEPFSFQQYNNVSGVVSNNGHTLKLAIDAARTPKLTGGSLSSEYKVDSLHFHWGSQNQLGSEHTINGDHYPLEMHIVHFNSAYGETLHEALENSGGAGDALAVLGVMFDVKERDGYTSRVDWLRQSLLSDLVDKAVEERDPIRLEGHGEPSEDTSSSALIDINIDPLLPINKEVFFRYDGSLTTPPCSEVVVWTLFKEIVSINPSTMEKLRQLEDSSDRKLADNFRPIQLKNHRDLKEIHTKNDNRIQYRTFNFASGAAGINNLNSQQTYFFVFVSMTYLIIPYMLMR